MKSKISIKMRIDGSGGFFNICLNILQLNASVSYVKRLKTIEKVWTPVLKKLSRYQENCKKAVDESYDY